MYPANSSVAIDDESTIESDEFGSCGVAFCRHLEDTHELGVCFAPCLMPMSDRIKVAFVAPSLRILGGQAVQADRLLSAWRGDPDVDAWLVPVNPLPPRAAPLRAATSSTCARSSTS